MSFTDCGLPQILIRKHIFLEPLKYAKVKLLIKFIKNSTHTGQFTFWQFKANFTVIIHFTMILYIVAREVTSPIIFDSPFLTSALEITLIPQENSSFIEGRKETQLN